MQEDNFVAIQIELYKVLSHKEEFSDIESTRSLRAEEIQKLLNKVWTNKQE
jgi:hypothetical protein